MNRFKKLCRDIAAIPKIMTFSDIAKAAASGASCWNNTPGGAWVGAILGVSMEASKRAHEISSDLMAKAENLGKDTTINTTLPPPPGPRKR